jgi:hypothetical protein
MRQPGELEPMTANGPRHRTRLVTRLDSQPGRAQNRFSRLRSSQPPLPLGEGLGTVSVQKASGVIFVPVDVPAQPSLEDKCRAWIDSLSVLDRQMLVQHCQDRVLPDRVRDLFKYAPIPDEAWGSDGAPRTFYPQVLQRQLGGQPAAT